MCYIPYAEARTGIPVSKTEIADELGVSRAGINKMMEKTEDLVTVECMSDGLFQLTPTDKGKRQIGRILGGL